MIEENCCAVSCNNPLSQDYWNAQYESKNTGWDLGTVSPPIKNYIDTITDKKIKILIPGCGNTYEAEYLLEKGFLNITVIDIAPSLVETLKLKFKGNSNINIILGDFFELHEQYDLIIEQTFFCALSPALRQRYVWKMYHLLNDNGIIAGLLFNRNFDVSPPFGGSQEEYFQLFKASFDFVRFEKCKDSVSKRLDSELFFEFKKSHDKTVNLYKFSGITCSGCKNTVTEKFFEIEGVKNVSISSDFSEVLMVSNYTIPIENLTNSIAYDKKYSLDLLSS